jgi:predicted enzyme related to lactoylglutathione lyase
MEVDHFDATSNLIVARGGQVALPKFAVPGTCWQGYFIDPEGNTFGIFEVDSTAR